MRRILQICLALLTVVTGSLALPAQSQVTVLAEIHRPGLASAGTFTFTSIPSNTALDALNGKIPTLVSGPGPTGNSGGYAALTNGTAPTGADQPAANFFTNGSTRFVYDLGGGVPITQINSYSWHRDDNTGDRAPQVYSVYGAPNGAAINNATLAGYTKIADVDTTATGTTPVSASSAAHGNGGQHGVSISGISAAYRYLIFDTFIKAGQASAFYSEIDVIAAAPAAPAALVASGGSNAVLLNWTASPGASSYNVFRSLTAGGPYTQINAAGVTANSYTDTTAVNGTTYYYVVTAFNSSGMSGNSNEASATPAAPVFGTGDGLYGQYFAGDDTLFTPLGTTPILTEVEPAINFNGGNTGVANNPGPWPAALPTTMFTARWTGLFQSPVNGPVTFYVNSDDGQRLYINGVLVVNNPVFQGPTLKNSGPITLTAGQKVTITYDYFQGLGGYTAQLLYSFAGQAITIIPQTQLYSVIPAPNPPTGLTAVVYGPGVGLSWTASYGALTYNVYRSTTAGGPYTKINTGGVADTTYSDNAGLTIGTKYYYVVTAVNNTGESGFSNEASGTPIAGSTGTGDGLRGKYYSGYPLAAAYDATAIFAGTPIVSEVDPTVNFSDYGEPASPYNPNPFPAALPITQPASVPPAAQFSARWTGFFQSPISGPVTFAINTDDGGRLFFNGAATPIANSFVNQGPTLVSSAPQTLAAGTKYAVTIEYFNSGGAGQAQFFYSYPGLPLTIVPQAQSYSFNPVAPAAPANLTATGGSSAIFLNWSAGADNGAPAGTFNVLRSTTAGSGYGSVAAGITMTNYIDTTVTPGTIYYYVVTATNTYGSSGNSNQASAQVVPATEILHYDFEIGPAGQNPDPVTDITGSGSDGLIVGGAGAADDGFTPDAANGAWATIVLADGSSFTSLKPNFDFTSTFTVFMNAKLTDAAAIRPFIASNQTGGATGGFAFYVNDFNNQSHALVFETNSGTLPNIQTKTRTVPDIYQFDGKYHAVAAVVNRTLGLVSLYYDGTPVLVNGVIDTTWPTGTPQTLLGIFPGGGFRAVGSEFDDVRIINGLLTPAEVAALANVGATVTGQIALEGVTDQSLIPAAVAKPVVTVEFRTPGTTMVIKTANVTLTPVGAGSAFGTFSVSGVANGTYDVAFKTANSLRVVLPNAAVNGAATLTSVTLPGGDAANDNLVDIGDFGLLVNAYSGDITIPGSGYDAAADFNFDGIVDIGDFGILVNEYSNSGAP